MPFVGHLHTAVGKTVWLVHRGGKKKKKTYLTRSEGDKNDNMSSAMRGMPHSISSDRTSVSSEVLPLFERLGGVAAGVRRRVSCGMGRGEWTTEYDRPFSSESGGVMKSDEGSG